MIFILMAIAIVLLGIGIILICISNKKHNEDYAEPFKALSMLFGSALLFGSIVGTCVITNGYVYYTHLDGLIEEYEEDNEVIEQQMTDVLNTYISHESDIYHDLKIDDSSTALTIVAAYPELASSELVKAQVEVYYKNNEEIKKLKATKIEYAKYAWWLFLRME